MRFSPSAPNGRVIQAVLNPVLKTGGLETIGVRHLTLSPNVWLIGLMAMIPNCLLGDKSSILLWVARVTKCWKQNTLLHFIKRLSATFLCVFGWWKEIVRVSCFFEKFFQTDIEYVLMMELVYILVLEARFYRFDPCLAHQSFGYIYRNRRVINFKKYKWNKRAVNWLRYSPLPKYMLL